MVKASKRQQEERRKARKVNRAGLSLTDKVLSPTLHGRYAIAAGRILPFWEHSNLTLNAGKTLILLPPSIWNMSLLKAIRKAMGQMDWTCSTSTFFA